MKSQWTREVETSCNRRKEGRPVAKWKYLCCSLHMYDMQFASNCNTAVQCPGHDGMLQNAAKRQNKIISHSYLPPTPTIYIICTRQVHHTGLQNNSMLCQSYIPPFLGTVVKGCQVRALYDRPQGECWHIFYQTLLHLSLWEATSHTSTSGWHFSPQGPTFTQHSITQHSNTV